MNRQLEPEYMDSVEEADAYAAADFSEVNTAFAHRLVELAEARSAWALDLGCGPADIPRRVAQLRPTWQIAAVDASRAMLKLAIAPSHSVHRIQADAKWLPFPDLAFDIVFSNSILHHLPDPAPFWDELRRLGRPGAWILIRDLMRPDSESAARALVTHHAGTESPLLQEEFFRSLLAAFTRRFMLYVEVCEEFFRSLLAAFTLDEVRGQLDAAGLQALHAAAITDRHLDVWGQLDE